MTIVTDSLQYAQLLAQSLAEQCALVLAGTQRTINGKHQSESESRAAFISSFVSETSSRMIQERRLIASGADSDEKPSNRKALSIEIWRGEPGTECGHVCEDASSYFDRMWIKGKKKKRWFLFLQPLDTCKEKG